MGIANASNIGKLLDETSTLIKQLKQLSSADFVMLYDKAVNLVNLLEAER